MACFTAAFVLLTYMMYMFLYPDRIRYVIWMSTFYVSTSRCGLGLTCFPMSRRSSGGRTAFFVELQPYNPLTLTWQHLLVQYWYRAEIWTGHATCLRDKHISIWTLCDLKTKWKSGHEINGSVPPWCKIPRAPKPRVYCVPNKINGSVPCLLKGI